MPMALDMGMSHKHRAISNFTPDPLWEGHPSTGHGGFRLFSLLEGVSGFSVSPL